MDIEKLKQKILDLAIKGKLVPQDPNDEPASVLIEKIREEKAKLVKEGKIKASKEESYIYKGSDNCYYEKKGKNIMAITKELPFDIPSSWSWIRLNDIGLFRKGPFGSSLTKDMFVPEQTPFRIKVYEQKNAIQKDYSLGKYYISNEKFQTMQSFIVEPGDIIVSCAGTIGEIYVLPKNAEIGVINQALMRIRLYSKIIEKYFIIYFDSILKKEANDKGKGTGMKNIPPFDILKNMLLPIPPEKELRRIIDQLELLIPKIDKIGSDFANLNSLVDYSKSKLLDSVFGTNSSYKSYYENEFILGDVLQYEQPAQYIVNSTDYNDSYPTPVLTPGKTFILGYTNETEGIYRVFEEKVIIFDDFTTASRLVDFDFKVKSSAMKILKISDNKKFDIDYMYYYLQTINVINNTHKRYWISEYAPIRLKIHTFDEQKKIKNLIVEAFDLLDSINKL